MSIKTMPWSLLSPIVGIGLHRILCEVMTGENEVERVGKSTVCSKHMSRAMSMNVWLTLVGYWLEFFMTSPFQSTSGMSVCTWSFCAVFADLLFR